LCQRTGRARQQDSSIVVLDERLDRPLALLESARNLQDKIVQDYDPSQTPGLDEAAERKRQQSREQSPAAHAVLNDPAKCQSNPLQALNEYVKKTKAALAQEFIPQRRTDGGGDGDGNTKHVCCNLTYRSILRTITVDGTPHANKKAAKRQCATLMLAVLARETTCMV